MALFMMRPPRYPSIKVRSRSRNPLAMVAHVRQALRAARIAEGEIETFSRVALDEKPIEQAEELCREWVDWAEA